MRALWLAFLIAVGQAAAAAPNPVLGRVLGEVGENGEFEGGMQKRCFVYGNQVLIQDYDPVSGRTTQTNRAISLGPDYVQRLVQVIQAAERQREQARSHAVEAKPNRYYFGFTGSGAGGRRVRLFYSGGRTLHRQGQEAQELIQVVEQLCPHR